jgi:hypothetical protein
MISAKSQLKCGSVCESPAVANNSIRISVDKNKNNHENAFLFPRQMRC